MIVYRNKKFKMYNQPQRIDGYYFPSKKEARRYLELFALEKSGEIMSLKIHPSYEIDIGKNHITNYVADFQYYKNGKLIIEDVKGRKHGVAYDLFTIKKRLMAAINDHEVTEI